MHRSEYPVAFMCRVLGVTSSGYYAWRSRGPSRRAQADRVLQRRIEEIHQASRGIYGSPKIHEQLRQEGIRCSRKRVIRLMRLAHISSKRKRCYKRTTRRNAAQRHLPFLPLNVGFMAELASMAGGWRNALVWVA